MGEVIFIEEAAKQRDVTVQEAWDRFVAAMHKSKETLLVEDGIAAGKAYRQFVELFARKL